MRKIHDIELDGHTGPDGKFHATGVSLVENSGNPHTGIFVDDGASEGDTTVITVTLRPAEVLKAMRQRQDPEQFILQMLQSSGVPVEDAGTRLVDGKMTAHVLKLTKGVIYRWDNWNEIIYEWRSK